MRGRSSKLRLMHQILGAQADWTPDCHHLFYLTASEFIKLPSSLLLPPLEHKEGRKEEVVFIDIQIIQCRSNSTQLLLLESCPLLGLGGVLQTVTWFQ